MSSRTFAVIAGTVGLASAEGPKAVRDIVFTNGKLPIHKTPTLGGKGGGKGIGKGKGRFAPKPFKGAKKPVKTAPAEDDSSVAKDQRKPQRDQQAGQATGRAPAQRAAKPRQVQGQ